MKKTLSIILFPVLLLVIVLNYNGLTVPQEEYAIEHKGAFDSGNATLVSNVTSKDVELPAAKNKKVESRPIYNGGGDIRENIINYAFTLLGSPYVYGGNSKDGFDCSGFTTHVFDYNGVAIKRSSGLQSTEGFRIERKEAAPGDLVIFTGTDKSVREPGHVGIVISEPGDTIEFIHASSSRSDGGVKISQVEGSNYDARFLEVRRVL